MTPQLRYYYRNKDKVGFKEKYKRYQKKYYSENKEIWKNYRKKQRNILKQFLVEQKSKPCMDCNKSYKPWVMQFDHRNPATKVANVSYLVLRGSTSLKQLKSEINKCDLVCANCHTDRTHNRRHNHGRNA